MMAQHARNYIAATVAALDADELSLLTGSGNEERNERIRTAFYLWSTDYVDSDANLEDAWHEFIRGFVPVSVNKVKEVLNPIDIKEFDSFLADLRNSQSIPDVTSTYTVTLVYDEDDKFKGAWFSCHDNGNSYFFIWVDRDWAWEKLTSMVDVLSNAFRAANSGKIRKKTYSMTDNYSLVYEQVHYRHGS